jgi:putative alpha-1,2-mannosidase
VPSNTLNPDIPSRFNTSYAGLPGNDDSGAMASFMLLSMMGLFPNPGQNVYLISSPFFESLNVTNPLTGQTATIRAINFDEQKRNIYIQKAVLNGKPYTKNWIGHEFFAQGWTLELVLGDTESAWGTAVEDRPPSLSTTVVVG